MNLRYLYEIYFVKVFEYKYIHFASYLKSYNDAVKVLHSMSGNLENSAVATGLEKVSFHSKRSAKECSNCHTIALTSYASKLMLKIQNREARCQQYVNQELRGVQAVFRLKAEEPAIKWPTFTGS